MGVEATLRAAHRALLSGGSGGGGACLLALQERATPARAFYRAAEAAGWACDELQRDDARRVALVELTRTPSRGLGVMLGDRPGPRRRAVPLLSLLSPTCRAEMCV